MIELFNTVFINPIINALVLIYKLLLFLSVPYTLGFSIIVLTALVRFLIYPLTTSQLKSTHKMQELKPHLDRVKEKYKNDKARLQSEMMKLYREHGVNPAAGCLPILIQFPIFIALYNVFLKVVSIDTVSTVEEVNRLLYFPLLHLDKAWDPLFLGVSLSSTPSQWMSTSPMLLLIPLITTVLQFVQSKMMVPPSAQKEAKEKADDFQKVMQTQMVYLLPLMIGFFSYQFPVGLSLYWNTFTVFGIMQQRWIQNSSRLKR